MAVPELNEVKIPELHKKKGDAIPPDKATIDGNTSIKVGNKVKVVGHHGKKSTVWEGTIKKKNPDGTWDVDDLKVKFEEVKGKDKDKGTEDVSVTVTNVDGESQPVNTKDVPTIP